MTRTLFSYLCILSAFLAGGMLSSCNKDDLITTGVPPRIILDNPTGVYDVKVGRELTIAPRYENAEGATYTWKVDGVLRGTAPTFTSSWDEAGEYYIDLT
ncbi:MAG: PKD domain-containing protein, partial [Paramuribaculum sp.]|nr:PKD domain-containing protein [Paramuribaculum sp.]